MTHINGTPVVISPHATQEVPNYALGEWSRDPFVDQAEAMRIQERLNAMFGMRREPAAFQAGNTLIVHPAIAAELRRTVVQRNRHDDVAIWACPECARTAQVTLPNYYLPARICNCRFPAFVSMMVPITDAAKAIDAADYAPPAPIPMGEVLVGPAPLPPTVVE